MKIVAGPYACGKTHRLSSLIQRAAQPVRQIVPTASMAARTPGAITLFQLISQLVPHVSAPSEATLDREIRAALESLNLPPLRGVCKFDGFRRKLRALFEEISAPGISAEEFAGALDSLSYASATQRAIAAVYLRVESRLRDQGFGFAGARARMAAGRIRRRGAPAGSYFFDGFYSFSDAELDLVEALADAAEVALTVPLDWPGASRTITRLAPRADVEMLPPLLLRPRVEKFSAPSRVQECEEIARRIRARLASGGKPGDFGVIVRQPKIYLPLLRAAFSRYAVPAAFRFSEPLGRQPASRFCASVIESLLDGWNLERLHEAVTLPVSGLGATPEGDLLDFEMRKRIPARGFDGLPLLEERFGRFSAWAAAQLAPKAWASALSTLIESTAAAPWKQALAEAAAALPDRACTLAEFWPEALHAIRATVIRPPEQNGDAVAVVDAMEARQWRFGLAFVCGMLEGEFPAHPVGDAFFDDSTRKELARLGVPLRSSEDVEAEERALVDVAATRADEVVFSWPAVTPAGEDSLPSLVLETYPGDVGSARPSLPALAAPYRPPSRTSGAPPQDVQRHMGEPKTWRPTEIECFLQCPFQYLGRYTLRLQAPPPGPAERFDVRAQGTIAHKILRRVCENPALHLEAVLEEELRLLARKEHIPESHVTLWYRTGMLRVLRLFLAMPPEREDWLREYEWPFEFELVEGIRIKGRIDRFDSKERRAFAIDYKYSKTNRLRKSDAVQGGLYLLALQREGFSPEGFAYIALREDGEVVHYDAAPLMEKAREQGIAAATRAMQGEIAARPADPSLCGFCEFLPACRISQSGGAALGSGEAGE